MQVTPVMQVALVIYVVALILVFGLRTLQHFRRTGRTGWARISKQAGGPARWGAAAFALSLVAGLAGLVLAVIDTVAVAPLPVWVGLMGAVLAMAGLVVVLASQSAMGEAWRIGVNPTERTDLVTGGAFRWARNPIFTGMVITQFGVVVMVPAWLTGLSLLLLIGGIELQVRGVEEPYLTRMHGQQYKEYAARVGRFVPGIGH